MSFVGNWAARWKAANEAAATDEAYEGVRQAKRARVVEEAAAAEAAAEQPLQMSDARAKEVAREIVDLLDFGARRVGGKEYAQTEDDTEILVRVYAPVCKKRLPHDFTIDQIFDFLPSELIAIAVTGYIYGSKWKDVRAARRAAAEAAAAQPQTQPEKEVKGSAEVRPAPRVHAVS